MKFVFVRFVFPSCPFVTLPSVCAVARISLAPVRINMRVLPSEPNRLPSTIIARDSVGAPLVGARVTLIARRLSETTAFSSKLATNEHVSSDSPSRDERIGSWITDSKGRVDLASVALLPATSSPQSAPSPSDGSSTSGTMAATDRLQDGDYAISVETAAGMRFAQNFVLFDRIFAAAFATARGAAGLGPVPRLLPAGQAEAVLTWNERPRDLDLHMFDSTGGHGTPVKYAFHIVFVERIYSRHV